MYKTVLWATDGYDRADAALEDALGLVEVTGGRLIAVHCDQRLSGRGGSWPAVPDEDERRRKIRRQVAGLQARGVDVELVFLRTHRAAADVVAAIASERDADVVVCGMRGFGSFAGAFLGSFTHRLLHVAPCPVLAVPQRQRAETSAKRDQVAVGA